MELKYVRSNVRLTICLPTIMCLMLEWQRRRRWQCNATTTIAQRNFSHFFKWNRPSFVKWIAYKSSRIKLPSVHCYRPLLMTATQFNAIQVTCFPFEWCCCCNCDLHHLQFQLIFLTYYSVCVRLLPDDCVLHMCLYSMRRSRELTVKILYYRRQYEW